MDQLAYATGVDSVELRLRNDTEVDPLSGRPFSSRGMPQCLTEGAQRFGWSKRTPEPRSMRDSGYLIGGVASAIYTHWRWPAKVRVTINRDGAALVETGAHDLGTDTYTVMQQIAAEALGLPLEKVTVHLGDTRLPLSHAAIGSATMANAGASVLLAANALREKAIALALSGRGAPLAGAAEDVRLTDGGLTVGPLLVATVLAHGCEIARSVDQVPKWRATHVCRILIRATALRART
jgi:xanthine dehydrogenase YagR molybdenum-binding subunit